MRICEKRAVKSSYNPEIFETNYENDHEKDDKDLEVLKKSKHFNRKRKKEKEGERRKW